MALEDKNDHRYFDMSYSSPDLMENPIFNLIYNTFRRSEQ